MMAAKLQVKEWLTAAEIAELQLPGLPTSAFRVRERAEKDQWLSRPRVAIGGGAEFALQSLPAAAVARYRAEIAATEGSLAGHQRQRLEARLALLIHLDGLAASMGLNRAIAAMIEEAEQEKLPAELQTLVSVANARAGDDGARILSRRTLLRWRAERAKDATALAPRPAREAPPPPWAEELLGLYSRPQKPSLLSALPLLAAKLPDGMPMPSYHAARRFLQKMSVIDRNRGRMGPRELKQLRAFKRRDVSELAPLQLVLMDGHTFDAEVAHPRHGQPFRPEVTAVIDAASRKIIGWSVALAESQHAVMDALRHAAVTHGVPSILYVDRGSGYEGGIISAPLIGLLARMGTRHETSLPYNSQARGLIERAHGSIWVRAAKQLPTFIGADMDPEAKKKVHKLTRAAIKAGSTTPLLMSWKEFYEFARDQVAQYNARPHRGLPKVDGRRLSPNEVFQRWLDAGGAPTWLAKEEADELFRPVEIRVTRRGEIDLYGNRYFNRDLDHRTGERVAVAYDMHDASRVWVYDHAGRRLCEALLDGNKVPYMPVKTVAESDEQKRITGQLRRIEHRRAAVEGKGAPRIIDAKADELDAEALAIGERKLAALAPPAANDAAPAEQSSMIDDDVAWGRWALANPDALNDVQRTYFEERMKSWNFRFLLGLESGEESGESGM